MIIIDRILNSLFELLLFHKYLDDFQFNFSFSNLLWVSTRSSWNKIKLWRNGPKASPAVIGRTSMFSVLESRNTKILANFVHKLILFQKLCAPISCSKGLWNFNEHKTQCFATDLTFSHVEMRSKIFQLILLHNKICHSKVYHNNYLMCESTFLFEENCWVLWE